MKNSRLKLNFRLNRSVAKESLSNLFVFRNLFDHIVNELCYIPSKQIQWKIKYSSPRRAQVLKNTIYYLYQYPYLFAFRHSIQQMTTKTISSIQAADILQKAICSGSLGSHQNSVDGGYVGTKTPITVGKY